MAASVARIASAENESLPVGRSPGELATVFDASLNVERADVLLRRTDQYVQWQRLRQKNGDETRRLAEMVLGRETLLEGHAAGESINWQEFDRLTEKLRVAGLVLPTAKAFQRQQKPSLPPPSPRQADLTTASPAALANRLVDEEHLLILSAECPAVGLKQEMLAYGNGNTALLPLGDVARALDFELKADAEKQTVTGWFIAEDRTFSLDAAKQTVAIAGVPQPWPGDKIVAVKGEVYVDSRVLSQWFPVDFSVSTGDMSLAIRPREKLPIQAQHEREQKRKGLAGQEDMRLQHSVQKSPYELFSFPVMDVSLGGGVETDRRDDAALQLDHSVVAEGDFAHMGAKVFVSGDEADPLKNARVKLERVDPDAAMLGPLKASKVSVGDVSPASLPILGGSSAERGVAVSNGDVRRSRDFDATRFEGNAQPGWDVELHQNGNLLQSVRVGGDGRYLFENVPVYFGSNAFQVLALGPQGQRRMIETKNVNVGSGMLKAGAFEYNLSATQRRDSVVGLNDEVIAEDAGKQRLVGQVAYGLTDQLFATVGLSSVAFDDAVHNYMQAGAGGSFSALYGEFAVIQDSAGGSGQSLQGQAALGPVNVRGKHAIYSDFVDEDNPDKILIEKSSYGVNGRTADLSFMPSLTYALAKEHIAYADAATERYSARLGGRVQRVNVSNVLHWNESVNQGSDEAPFDGEFQASGALGPVRLIAGVGYEFGQDDAVDQYKISGFLPIRQGVSAGIRLARDEEETTAKISLNLDAGKYTLSPSLFGDSDGDWGAYLGLSFSLGHDPVSEDLVIQSEKRSGKGAVTALVYHDANNNKVFDQDETPLPEVKVVARQARQDSRTDGAGIARFTGLAAYEPTDVAVDSESLQDPFWQPSVPGVAVEPRPGNVSRLEFPVVTTGEVDGRVYCENEDGGREPLANVRLELQDGKGGAPQTVVAEYDGFYLFEKVPPGLYTLRVRSEEPRLKALAAGWQREVIIGNDGTIVRGSDIVLRATGTETPAQLMPSASSSAKSKPPASDLAASAPASSVTVRPLAVVGPEPAAFRQAQAPGREGETVAGVRSGSIAIAPLTVSSTSAPVLPPSTATAEDRGKGARAFGVHLASYKTMETAQAGMRILAKRVAGVAGASELAVVGVDLGAGKGGRYFRVVCGRFGGKEEADRLAARLLAKTDYARSVVVLPEAPIGKPAAVLPGRLIPKGLSPAAVAGKYAAMQQTR